MFVDVAGADNHKDVKVPSPAYMLSNGGGGLDLLSLVETADRSAAKEAGLGKVDVVNGAWPEAALEQYTTLDPAQRSAIQVIISQSKSHV